MKSPDDVWVTPDRKPEDTSNPHNIMRIYADKVFGFDVAIKLLKAGYRVYRRGWSGTGMWIGYQKGYPDGIAINKNTAEATGIEEGTVCNFLPYIMMKTASPSTTFVPWLASQTDLLSDDWMVAW